MNINNNRLHKLATVTAVFTIILIVAGATVTSTGAGDSIPDWPLSYGKTVPPLYGNIKYEYTHRIVAFITALLILTLTISAWTTSAGRTVKTLSTIALIAVILQALLGGLRVLIVSNENVWKTVQTIVGEIHNKDLRITFAIIHAILAQSILSLTFTIATITSKKWNEIVPPPAIYSDRGKLPNILAIIFLALIFTQILLGAIIRHKSTGLIIPDFPTTFNNIIPDFNKLPFNENSPYPTSYDEFKHNVILNFFHTRIIPIAVIVFIFLLLFIVKKHHSNNREVLKLTYVIIGHVVAQILLGMAIIWLKLPIILTILHTAIGASILGITVNLVLWTFNKL